MKINVKHQVKLFSWRDLLACELESPEKYEKPYVGSIYDWAILPTLGEAFSSSNFDGWDHGPS